MIKCIVFDMDDTLYDEVDYYKSGFEIVSHQVSADFGLKADDFLKALWEIFSAGNHKTTFNKTGEKLGLFFDKVYVEKLITIFRNHNPQITLPSESRKVLEILKDRYKLGLITDGYLPAQELKVKALGLEKFFDCIVYTEALGRQFWKPSSAGFEKLLSQLNVNAGECACVADNLKKDFIAPNQMRFKTIRIMREKRLHLGHAPTKEAEPQYKIDSISKLPELLKKIDAL